MDSPSGSPQPQPDLNPYAAPSVPYGGHASSGISQDEAERTRRELIHHEASIRSVGSLYLLAAILGVMGLVVVVIYGFLGVGDADGSMTVMLVGVVFYGAIAALAHWVGNGLRQLDVSVRSVAIVLSVIGLLAFPVGTLINGYILYLLVGQKGKRVLSLEYAEVIQATPHIQHKSSLLVGCAIILVVVVILVVASVYFAP